MTRTPPRRLQIFQIRTAADLREKLRHEFDQLKKNRNDQYVAFNFFITAWHLLDWQFPGDSGRAQRDAALSNEVLLRVCQHLANGAKHFELGDPNLKSVTAARRGGGYFSDRYFGRSFFGQNYFGAGSGLIVDLDGDAASTLAPRIEVLDLATRVLAYWNGQAL